MADEGKLRDALALQRSRSFVEVVSRLDATTGREKLTDRELYRVRQGVYRIAYSIDDLAVVIEVIKIGHRREVYRA